MRQHGHGYWPIGMGLGLGHGTTAHRPEWPLTDDATGSTHEVHVECSKLAMGSNADTQSPDFDARISRLDVEYRSYIHADKIRSIRSPSPVANSYLRAAPMN
eukprot:6183674-Pleurochrysis_carterae.AAC.3